MEYQVALTYPDLVVGSISDMKLVKSRYLSDDPTSIYSRPTYIVIRSLKYSRSSAFPHLHDMNRVRSLPEVTNSFQNQNPKEKKVMILIFDRGPDNNRGIRTLLIV